MNGWAAVSSAILAGDWPDGRENADPVSAPRPSLCAARFAKSGELAAIETPACALAPYRA